MPCEGKIHDVMLYEFPGALPRSPRLPRFGKYLAIIIVLTLTLTAFAGNARAQALVRELNLPEKATVSIKNRNGRVTVIATDEQKGVASVKAESPGAAVEETDV